MIPPAFSGLSWRIYTPDLGDGKNGENYITIGGSDMTRMELCFTQYTV